MSAVSHFELDAEAEHFSILALKVWFKDTRRLFLNVFDVRSEGCRDRQHPHDVTGFACLGLLDVC